MNRQTGSSAEPRQEQTCRVIELKPHIKGSTLTISSSPLDRPPEDVLLVPAAVVDRARHCYHYALSQCPPSHKDHEPPVIKPDSARSSNTDTCLKSKQRCKGM